MVHLQSTIVANTVIVILKASGIHPGMMAVKKYVFIVMRDTILIPRINVNNYQSDARKLHLKEFANNVLKATLKIKMVFVFLLLVVGTTIIANNISMLILMVNGLESGSKVVDKYAKYVMTDTIWIIGINANNYLKTVLKHIQTEHVRLAKIIISFNMVNAF